MQRQVVMEEKRRRRACPRRRCYAHVLLQAMLLLLAAPVASGRRRGLDRHALAFLALPCASRRRQAEPVMERAQAAASVRTWAARRSKRGDAFPYSQKSPSLGAGHEESGEEEPPPPQQLEEAEEAFDPEEAAGLMDQEEHLPGPALVGAAEESGAGGPTVWDNFIEILDPQGEGGSFMLKTVPYFFLRDELGISEAKMLRISLDHGQVLALSVERNLRPKVAWLRAALRLTRAQAAQLVGASPGLLLLSVEDNLAPKLRWLRDELGVSDEERRRLVLRCPQLLTASTGSLLLKLAFLQDDVGLGRADLQRAVRTMPALLVLSLDTLVDKAEFLTEELGMTMGDVGFLLVRAPAVFFQALDTGLKPKLRFLRRDLGLAAPQVRALVRRAPRLLNYRIASHGRALLHYLTRSPLDLSREEAVKVVLRAPALLGMDIASPRFVDAVQALKEALGVKAERDLTDVVRRFPGALGLTAPRIQATVDALTGPSVGCNRTEAAAVLRKHPQALGYRPAAVAEKLAAAAGAYGLPGGAAAARPALLKAPAMLSYSVEGRLRPRLEAAAAAGVPLEKAVGWLALPAARFEERLERATSEALPLEGAPLLKQRANARLLRLLRRQRMEKGKGKETIEGE